MKSISNITACLFAYATICGVFWHLGFWTTFDFNYLEYASIGDLFKSTLSPFFAKVWVLFITLVFCLGISFVSTSLLFFFIKKNSSNTNKSFKLSALTPRANKWFYFIISILFCFAGFLIMASIRKNIVPATWLIGIVLLASLFVEGLFAKYFKNDAYRFFFLAILIFYPLFNFTNAKNTALQMKYRFIYTSITDIIVKDTSIRKLVINQPLIGKTENYIFILTGDKNITILQKEQIELMTVSHVVLDSNYDNWINR